MFLENIFGRILILCSILVVISFFLSRLWLRILPGKKYQFVVFPGVVVHELSHLIACLITGASIKEVKFFSSQGGYVKHGKPKLPLIGKPLISFAPIAGGIAFLIGFLKLLNLSLPLIPSFSGGFYDAFLVFSKSIVAFFSSNWGGCKMWIFVYFSISIIICLIPSRKDLKNALLGTVILSLIIFGLIYFNVSLEFLNSVIQYLSIILITGIFFGAVALLISLLIYFLKTLI